MGMAWGDCDLGGARQGQCSGVFSTGLAMGFGFAPCHGEHGHLLWLGCSEVGASPLGWILPPPLSGTRLQGDAAPCTGIFPLVPKAWLNMWQSWSLGPAEPFWKRGDGERLGGGWGRDSVTHRWTLDLLLRPSRVP